MEEAIVRDPSLFLENLKKAGLEGKEKVKQPLKNWQFCETGDPQFLNLRKNEGEQTLYFPYSIEAEMELWIKSLPIKNCKLLAVYGVGLGYQYLELKRWLEEDSDRLLLIIEDDPEVLHAFLETSIAREVLENPQVKLSYKEDEMQWQSELRPYLMNTFFQRRHIASIISYEKYKNQSYHYVRLFLDMLFHLVAQAESEYFLLGEFFHQQFFRNFLNLSEFSDGGKLKNRFQGIPAIVCGAGPSLARHKDLFHALKDKALILAGGTGMNAMNALGVTPHFGAGLDPFPAQLSRILENSAFTVPYFIKSRMLSTAVEALMGDKLYAAGDDTYPVVAWLEKQAGISQDRNISVGSNVLHFCVNLAKMLGCNPIIMVGVDLAYTGGNPYSEGVQVHGTFEPRAYLQSKSKDDDLILLQDIHGNPIYTQSKWVFESMHYTNLQAVNPDIKLINCTEGGIGLQGIPNQNLKETIANWLGQGDLCGRLDAELAALEEEMLPSGESPLALETALLKKVDALLKKTEYIAEDLQLSIFQQEMDVDEELETLLRPFLKMMDPVSQEKSKHAEIRSKLFESKEKVIRAVLISIQMTLSDAIREAKMKEAALRKKTPVSVDDHQDEVPFQEPEDDKEFDEKTQTGWKRRHDVLGNLLEESYYLKGVLNGPVRHYSEKGALLGESWFIKGERSGTQKTYFPSGNLYALKPFKEGKEEGLHRYFFSDGQLKAEIPFHNGLLSGTVKIYYRNGSVKRQVDYVEGLKHGGDSYYQQNGKLLSESFYKKQKPYGIAKVWSQKGVLLKEIRYFLPGVIFEAKEFNEQGKEIQTAGAADFYDIVVKKSDQLQKTMKTLTNSLEKVFGGSEDLTGLKGELSNLNQMASLMKQKAGLAEGDYREPLWKSQVTKENMIQAIDQLSEPMMKELKGMQEQLEKLQERLKGDEGGKQS